MFGLGIKNSTHVSVRAGSVEGVINAVDAAIANEHNVVAHKMSVLQNETQIRLKTLQAEVEAKELTFTNVKDGIDRAIALLKESFLAMISLYGNRIGKLNRNDLERMKLEITGHIALMRSRINADLSSEGKLTASEEANLIQHADKLCAELSDAVVLKIESFL